MDELFYKIDHRQKLILLKILEANTIAFKKNKFILQSVNQDNFICILLTGHVQIIKTDYDGNRTIIEDLKENSVFGTITSYLSNNEYDILTKEDSKIILIDYDEIINYDDTKSSYFIQFLKNLLQIMSNKILKNNERIEILTNKTTRDKLLTYFKLNSNQRIVNLQLTFTDLADYLSVNRSAMQRELKNLKDEGFIEIKDKKIKLLYDIS